MVANSACHDPLLKEEEKGKKKVSPSDLKWECKKVLEDDKSVRVWQKCHSTTKWSEYDKSVRVLQKC